MALYEKAVVDDFGVVLSAERCDGAVLCSGVFE